MSEAITERLDKMQAYLDKMFNASRITSDENRRGVKIINDYREAGDIVYHGYAHSKSLRKVLRMNHSPLYAQWIMWSYYGMRTQGSAA